MPKQLRQFFAFFIMSENSPFGYQIWEKYKKNFIEGFKNNNIENALTEINNILQSENFQCSDFGLPSPSNTTNDFYEEEKLKFKNECKILFEEYYKQLNTDQLQIFNKIISGQVSNLIFIDGPGGTGKTFLYKTLIYYFISHDKNVLSMTWTGIASILLPKGMTSHRTFRLPLNLSNIKTSFLKFESDKKLLREVDVIIWDEASMIPKKL